MAKLSLIQREQKREKLVAKKRTEQRRRDGSAPRRSARDEDKLARNPGELARILAEVRSQGYASAIRARRVSDEISLAVPVRLQDRLLACLTVRFSAGAVPMKAALDRMLPRLFAAAERIGSEFSAQQAADGRRKAP